LRSIQKGPILCLGPGEKTTQEQVERIVELGGIAIGINGFLKPKELITLDHISGVVWWGDDAREYLIALAHRTGPIIPLITEDPDLSAVIFERHLCIDTTAAGGNTTLLSG
jgi:RHH-type proline utilization regulon transcriptional repressor/proline dehydrogenase/delta 1-pyrroline-5-carboxylate dehydrogenase